MTAFEERVRGWMREGERGIPFDGEPPTRAELDAWIADGNYARFVDLFTAAFTERVQLRIERERQRRAEQYRERLLRQRVCEKPPKRRRM